MAQSALERVVSAGLSALRALHGVSATCARGSETHNNVRVIPGEQRKGVLTDTGSEVVVQIHEFLIDVADWPWDAPQVGDTITRVVNGEQLTWSVESLNQGESAFDWSDTARTRFRVQTRRDGANAFEITKPNGFDLAGDEIRYDD